MPKKKGEKLKKIKAKIYDAETGEYLKDLYSGDRILRNESLEYLGKTVEINKNELYIKVFQSVLSSLIEECTGAELRLLFYLSQYLQYNSGLVALKNRPLTRKEIAENTGLSLKTLDRLLSSLQRKEIIYKNRAKKVIEIYINPWLFMRGTRVYKELYNMFKNSKWADRGRFRAIEAH